MIPDEMTRLLAWLDLQSDAVFNKIPPARYRYYLDNALSVGERTADEFQGCNIRELYQQHGIEIQHKLGDGLFFTVQFRAQFEYSEKKDIRRVILYQSSLENLQASCAQAGIDVSLDTIIDIHLAHEFFHFLEYSRHQPVSTSLDKICHFSFGPIRCYSTVVTTSEIAAHRFCQRLLKLRHYPTYYDFLWLVNSGKQTEQEKEALFAQARGELQQMA